MCVFSSSLESIRMPPYLSLAKNGGRIEKNTTPPLRRTPFSAVEDVLMREVIYDYWWLWNECEPYFYTESFYYHCAGVTMLEKRFYPMAFRYLRMNKVVCLSIVWLLYGSPIIIAVIITRTIATFVINVWIVTLHHLKMNN